MKNLLCFELTYARITCSLRDNWLITREVPRRIHLERVWQRRCYSQLLLHILDAAPNTRPAQAFCWHSSFDIVSDNDSYYYRRGLMTQLYGLSINTRRLLSHLVIY